MISFARIQCLNPDLLEYRHSRSFIPADTGSSIQINPTPNNLILATISCGSTKGLLIMNGGFENQYTPVLAYMCVFYGRIWNF